MTAYRCTFPRIGRSSNGSFVETFTAADADDLAEQVFRFAKRKLASRMFVVSVDLERMVGSIEYDRFGTFTIESVPA